MAQSRDNWSGTFGFVLAAMGSAVGLGNVWRFPSVTGEYGGGAFILVYLGCVLAVGIPIMIAELLIGRSTQRKCRWRIFHSATGLGVAHHGLAQRDG